MSVLLESPWPVLTAAIGIELALVVMLARTGRGQLFAVMAAVGVVAAILLAIELYVVTDREQIEDALTGIAAGLMKNDPEAVVQFVAPQATKIRQAARSQMPQVVIREARIGRDLAIHPNLQASPPTATARFTARIDGKFKRGDLPHEIFLQRFEVSFEKQQDHWLVTSYKESR